MKTMTKTCGMLLLAFALTNCNRFEERREQVLAKFCAKMVRCGQDVYTITMPKCMSSRDKFTTETSLAEIEDFAQVATCNDMVLLVINTKGQQ